MMKRPIFWGLIGFVVGLAGWLVAVILSVLTLGEFRLFAVVFGYLFIVSIPLGLLGEAIRWLFRRKK